MDEAELEQALELWITTKPTKREGQAQDEYNHLRNKWFEAQPQRKKKAKVVQETKDNTDTAKAKGATGTGPVEPLG